ncbi:MAG TPA: methyltransferase domain-containing protein [Paraburkholderia sp.]|nr:methyltransferase domain-containing protein [Paraburkholderia sp.]
MDSFYRAFEDRYRGSRELITSRLQVYLPFVRPLVEHRADAIALDLGCGRGEWLDIVSSEGFRSQGVDLDEGMLMGCRERGLDVERRDALDKLRSLPDASIALVTAFHVVEHISFDDVRELIAESLRILVPGGLLVMETPNPENVVVAGSRFYMDPSHVKPLPPPLLSFAAEYAGFERVKVLRLQEAEALHDPAAAVSLLNVLEEVSPDYSVVAQKGGDEVLLAATAAAFEPEYGLTLPALAIRHAEYVDARFLQLETRLGSADTRLPALDARLGSAEGQLPELETRLHRAETRLPQLEARLSGAEGRFPQLEESIHEARVKAVDAQTEAKEIVGAVGEAIQGALRNAGADRIPELEGRVQHAEELAHFYLTQLQEVHASTSWRVTAPLRAVGTVVHTLRRNLGKSNAKRVVRGVARFAQARPWLAGPALTLLKRFPRLKQRLARVLIGFDAPSTQPTIAMPSDAVHLTPHAQEVYAILKAAVDRKDTET